MTERETVVTEPVWFESTREMSLGLMLPVREGSMDGETPRFEDLLAMAMTARDAGFEALWFADHFTMGEGDDMAGVWECWTMMAAVAARVPGVQIGPLVSCAGFRNPGLVAKMAESIDEISNGRFILGFGAGWNATEYRQFGYPFDYRASRFEDAIQIIRPLLREGRADVQGRFFQANDAVNRPRGPRPAGAPLLIGSNGKRLLNTVARHADAWNSDWESDPAKMVELIAAVDAACDAVGRSPSTLVKTGMARFAMREGDTGDADAVTGSIDKMAERLVAFRNLGLRHFVCGLEPRSRSSVEQFGEVIMRFDALH
jgi:alkanesulfonate monooxygenase SsuD/methylene tetrahydromethanopterin reductase-like flavin-dependent oxidoreductase (luciferase family)